MLERIAAGNFHRPGGLRTLQVGEMPADRYAALRAELLDVAETCAPSIVGTGHQTGWTRPTGTVVQWSLFNRHGDTGDPSDDFNYQLDGKQVPAGLPLTARFADTLPGLVNLRLNMLGAGAALAPHEEHLPRPLPDGKVGLRARFHLPIDTNPEALMLADGHLFRFQPGCVYLFNNGCVHAAVNEGTHRRLHLVWDMLLTDAACRTMFDTGSDWLDCHLDDVPVVRETEITEWQPSTGMSAGEFDRRTLVYMP
jgi:hypothetical protein